MKSNYNFHITDVAIAHCPHSASAVCACSACSEVDWHSYSLDRIGDVVPCAKCGSAITIKLELLED